MLPKTGSRLPNSHSPITEAALRRRVSEALKLELGSSHRAAKTIMAWTGVSDRTARSWLNGDSSLSGVHLMLLTAHSTTLMSAMLNLAGYPTQSVIIDLAAAEQKLLLIVEELHQLREKGQSK